MDWTFLNSDRVSGSSGWCLAVEREKMERRMKKKRFVGLVEAIVCC